MDPSLILQKYATKERIEVEVLSGNPTIDSFVESTTRCIYSEVLFILFEQFSVVCYFGKGRKCVRNFKKITCTKSTVGKKQILCIPVRPSIL